MGYLDRIDNRYLYGAIGVLGGWGIADILGASELIGGAIGGGLGYYKGRKDDKNAYQSQAQSQVQTTSMKDVDRYLDGSTG